MCLRLTLSVAVLLFPANPKITSPVEVRVPPLTVTVPLRVFWLLLPRATVSAPTVAVAAGHVEVSASVRCRATGDGSADADLAGIGEGTSVEVESAIARLIANVGDGVSGRRRSLNR